MNATSADDGVVYGVREFAEAYVLAKAADDDPYGGYVPEKSAYNTALRAYRERMLTGLQRLFGLTLDMEAVSSIPGGPALFMLFNSTTRSCLALRTPWSSFLEAGLLYRRLQEADEAGRRIMMASERIDRLNDESRRAHLEILEQLLSVLLGERAELTFTSTDLQKVGVTGTEPSDLDYAWDE